jgi:hypothetical protein
MKGGIEIMTKENDKTNKIKADGETEKDYEELFEQSQSYNYLLAIFLELAEDAKPEKYLPYYHRVVSIVEKRLEALREKWGDDEFVSDRCSMLEDDQLRLARGGLFFAHMAVRNTIAFRSAVAVALEENEEKYEVWMSTATVYAKDLKRLVEDRELEERRCQILPFLGGVDIEVWNANLLDTYASVQMVKAVKKSPPDMEEIEKARNTYDDALRRVKS